ncbi:MAG: HD domain-containing phosphohydrolase [bacterium]
METSTVTGSDSLGQLAILLVLAGSLGFFAWRAYRVVGIEICRKLFWLALIQVGAATLKLGELLAGVAAWPLLVAFHSVLDLAVMGLFVFGIRRLQQRSLLSLSATILLATVALSALFWSVLSGAGAVMTLAGNGLSGAGQLLFYAVAATLICRVLLRELQNSRHEATSLVTRLTGENLELRQAVTETSDNVRELTRRQTDHKEETVQLRHRTRVLERILAVSVHINATHDMSELLEKVANSVREVLGFNMVLLRLFSNSTKAFEARAFAGIPEEGKAHLAGIQVSLAEYQKLAQPQFRVSNSYFIGHEKEGASEATAGAYVPDLGPRDAGEWHEDDTLIIPLISPAGETKGYLSVDDPADRHRPSVLLVRQLEFLASQAATAIESAEIYDRLARQNRELAQASEELNSLADMKANFVANVSHELRTPLTSITAYAEILEKGARDMSEEVRGEFLKVIGTESAKLSGIIDDILELSRMEGQPAATDRGEVDLMALMHRLETTAGKRAAEKDVTFTLRLPEDPIRLRVDAVLLQQMLDHLLNNAFKFTPAGGSVSLSLIDRGNEVQFEVADTGIGIPEAQMDSIFGRFYQADGSATREHGGQGVGLALCRDIVRHHEGRIWVENVLPSGSCFRVVLPRRAEVIQKIAENPRDWPLHDPAEFMEKLVHWIGDTLDVDIVSLLVPDAGGECLEIAAAMGLPARAVQSTRIRRGAGIVGKVWASRRTLQVSDITSDARLGKTRNDPRYTTPSLLSVPLLVGMDVIGVVNVNNHRDGRPLDEMDTLLLEGMSPHISHLLGLVESYRATVFHFASLLKALRSAIMVRRNRHDNITTICQQICVATARRIKLPSSAVEHLSLALQLYDVGLVELSDQILQKTTELSAAERDELRRHVVVGLEILEPLHASPKVRQIILHHHERFDGGGYPDGLEGEAIPIGARLLALTDSLNAMLHHRPYRSRRTYSEAVAEIEAAAGSQFCPRLVEPFLRELAARRDEIEAQTGIPAVVDSPRLAEPVPVA